jgi:hypothetical protein
LIDKHGGEVPQSFEYLEELPARAIKLQCSNVASQFQLSCGYPYSSIDVSMEFDQW